VYRSRFLHASSSYGSWWPAPPVLQSRLQATFPDYQSRVLTMAQPFVWGDVATMLRLVIMGAKEKSLAAGSA
jgi:hypothetical protein